MRKRKTHYSSYVKKDFCFLPKSAESQPNQPGQGWRFGLDRGLDVNLAMRTNHVLCPRLKIRTHHLYYLNDLLRLARLNGSHGWHRLYWRWCFLVGWWRLLVHRCILGRWLSKSTWKIPSLISRFFIQNWGNLPALYMFGGAEASSGTSVFFSSMMSSCFNCD